MKPPRIHVIVVSGIILLVTFYVGSYLSLSRKGKYVIANFGGNDWKKVWCPEGLVKEVKKQYEINGKTFVGRTTVEITPRGIKYAPLIGILFLLSPEPTEADWH